MTTNARRRGPLVLAGLLLAALPLPAQSKPDVIVFDETESVGGVKYYDSSFGAASAPSTLTLAGPGSDKLMINTNQHYTGKVCGAFGWKSGAGGTWTMFVARPGWVTADVRGYSNVVLYLNGPLGLPADQLPKVGLESSPPDQRTPALNLSGYLPGGLDSDTNTWQRVVIPLSAFQPYGAFTLAALKDVYFTQGPADGLPHTLWLDDVRVVAGGGGTNAPSLSAPQGLAALTGDQSVVLHWDPNPEAGVAGYNVYRAAAANGSFARLTPNPATSLSWADLIVTNGQPYYYYVRAVNGAGQEGTNSATVNASPQPFADDNAFLDYVQHTAFDYFWYEANPTNGLVRDRSEPYSEASIAATGFGLTALGIGIDHGWISRARGRARALATLRTFAQGPQGTNATGVIGYQGWFYHFLDLGTGLRASTTELSSIDTALLLAGVLYAKQYFDGPDPDEVTLRALADALYAGVNWSWMANGGASLTMGWHPDTGFIGARWIGYDEGMILYLLGLGAPTNALPPADWQSWTSGYQWATNYGYAFVQFPPLFGHQYSHCWVDFRHVADAYMSAKQSTYAENSRRATLAQRAYAIANPGGFTGYSSNVWGLTACDGPGVNPYFGYIARGAPPPQNDDGTIAPTAAGGSFAFTPEYSLPTLRYLYDQYRANLWTGYGFRDAFNLSANWWDPDVIGIDQGPILLMIENHRSQRVWKLFRRNPEIQRGLAQAGFAPLAFASPRLEREPAQNGFVVSWDTVAGKAYQVEFSPDLDRWYASPTGNLEAAGSPLTWLDLGPPATDADPATTAERFYRVFQFGAP